MAKGASGASSRHLAGNCQRQAASGRISAADG
jgi:hypothetical protein